MRYLAILLVVASFAVVYAQVPGKCVTPNEWEARMFENDPSRGYDRIGRMYYDANNERIAFTEEIDSRNFKEAYQDILLFKEKIGYRINMQTKQCSKFTLTDEFEPFEIPSDAEFVDELVIGTNAGQALGVTVDLWTGMGRRGKYLSSVTHTGCVPVAFTEFGGEMGGFRHRDYYDVVEGTNPDHFIPPPQCQ